MKTGILSAVLMLTACGVSQTEITTDDSIDTDGAELSTVSRTYVTFTRDFRKCMAPMCGGWWVTDVNRANPTPRYVSGLDFAGANLDEATVAKALEGGDREVVLRGKLGAEESRFHTRPFLVTDAWRGMPGVVATAGQNFYKVEAVEITCFKAPCPSMKATKLNTGGGTLIDALSVADASLPRVDQEWLKNRLQLHGAIASAKVVNGAYISGSYEKVLSASQVFVKLPESIGPCPLRPIAQCPEGKIHSFSRTADRCEVPGGCVTPGYCALYVPSCPEGYTLQSWSGGQFACQVYACDPAWSL